MNKNRKISIKIISCILLVLCLLVTIVSFNKNSVKADVDGHFHGTVKFEAWTDATSLPAEAGSYYLTTNVTLSKGWEVPEGEVSLCLNGYVINLPKQTYSLYETFYVAGDVVFNLYDCNTERKHYFKEEKYSEFEEGTYWVLDDTLNEETADYVVNSGVITSGCCDGIQVCGDAVFNMYGGALCGFCASTRGAGGVCVEDGTFNLYDGLIAGNYNMATGGVAILAEEIEDSKHEAYIDYPSVFNMYGGSIEHNCAGFYGGGLCVMGSTFNMYGGSIKNNSTVYEGGGVCVTADSIMTMHGGTIEGNEAMFGGGVFVGFLDGVSMGDYAYDGTLIMHGGEIKNNRAIQNVIEDYESTYSIGGLGGGVYVLYGSTFIADGGVVSGNIADLTGGGVYMAMEYLSDPYFCVAGDTPITLADGTRTNVENLKIGDIVRVFDHKTGQISTSKIFYLEKSSNVKDNVFTLHFTNDIDITVISGHSFYSKDDNCYVTLTLDNVADYIGKEFYNADNASWETLSSYEVVTSGVDSYSIVTEKTINVITNGMLSCGDEIYLVLSNIFDFDADLKHNETQKASDIETYGLWEYSDAEYATLATYEALNLQYIKIAIGKGLITAEQFSGAGAYQDGRGNDLVKHKAGITLGGTIQIVDNVNGEEELNNLFIWKDENSDLLNIGTGTEIGDGENGVKVPQKGMLVGISLHSIKDEVKEVADEENPVLLFGADADEISSGAFSYEILEDYTDYFKADLVYQYVKLVDDQLTIDNYVCINTTQSTGHLTLEDAIANAETGDTIVLYDDNSETITVSKAISFSIDPNEFTNSATITADEGYSKYETGVDTITYSIKQKIAKPAADDTEFIYDETEQTYVLEENDAYSISENVTQTNVGSYTIVVSLNDTTIYEWEDGSTDDLEYIFEILKIKNAISDFEIEGWTYGDKANEPSASATYGTVEFTYSEEEDGEYTDTVPVNAGYYYVKAEVAATDTIAGAAKIIEFEIEKKELTVTIADKTSEYGEDLVELTATCNGLVNGNVAGDIFRLETDATSESEAGEYLIYPIDNNGLIAHNYDVVYVGTYIQDEMNMGCSTYTITKAQITKPAANSTKFVYTGSAQTYTLATNDAYTISNNNTQTKVGTYEVTVTLNDTDNYEWKDGTIVTLKYSFVISKAQIEKPYPDSLEFVYTGKAQTYTLASSELYTISDSATQTNAGSYEVTLTIKDTTNYEWKDGTTAPAKYSFVINKAQIEKPTSDSTNFVYTGKAQIYTLASNDAYTISNNTTQTKAGTYEIKVALKDTSNYEWLDKTSEELKYPFVIAKAENKITELSIENWIYGEAPKTPKASCLFGEIQFMYSKAEEISYSFDVPTEIGNYILRATVFSTDDYGTDDKKIEFTIYQRANDVVIKNEDGTEKENSEVVIEEAEAGIDPEAILVVKVIEIKNEEEIETSKKALDNEEKISKKEKIYGLYDAKLLLNGDEIQPNGTIKIKVLIPEKLQGKEFKLYHIHNESEVIDVEYEVEGNYAIFVTDKLSQFAFVGEKGADCIIHWFLIILLVVGIVLFVLFNFVLDKDFYALLSCVAGLIIAIILAILGNCIVCTIFSIVDIVAFVGGIVYLLLNKYVLNKECNCQDDNPQEDKPQDDKLEEKIDSNEETTDEAPSTEENE